MFKKRDEKGQSLVEAALTLPILILIVMGILDLGRAYMTYISMSDAAAEGAAYAAVYPRDTDNAIIRAAESTGGLIVLDPDMISIEYEDLSPGSDVTVIVEFDYQILTPIMNGFVTDGIIRMRATATQAIISDG